MCSSTALRANLASTNSFFVVASVARRNPPRSRRMPQLSPNSTVFPTLPRTYGVNVRLDSVFRGLGASGGQPGGAAPGRSVDAPAQHFGAHDFLVGGLQ